MSSIVFVETMASFLESIIVCTSKVSNVEGKVTIPVVYLSARNKETCNMSHLRSIAFGSVTKIAIKLLNNSCWSEKVNAVSVIVSSSLKTTSNKSNVSFVSFLSKCKTIGYFTAAAVD